MGSLSFFFTGQGSEKRSEKLTANQKQILLLLSHDNHLTARKQADQVGILSRKIEQNITKLKKLGRLNRIGPPKIGYWEVLE